MLIAGKYEVPDECPVDCKYCGDMGKYGQNSICGRCPVFVCPGMVEPEGYRDDWAEEWVKFFETGREPDLRFKISKER